MSIPQSWPSFHGTQHPHAHNTHDIHVQLTLLKFSLKIFKVEVNPHLGSQEDMALTVENTRWVLATAIGSAVADPTKAPTKAETHRRKSVAGYLPSPALLASIADRMGIHEFPEDEDEVTSEEEEAEEEEEEEEERD